MHSSICRNDCPWMKIYKTSLLIDFQDIRVFSKQHSDQDTELEAFTLNFLPPPTKSVP